MCCRGNLAPYRIKHKLKGTFPSGFCLVQHTRTQKEYICKMYKNNSTHRKHTDLIIGLPSHPNILAPTDVKYTRSVVYIVIQEHPCDLYVHMTTMSDSDIPGMVRGIVSGIAHMHRYGVVHGDIKLENVVVTATGIPKLIDFESAHTVYDIPDEHRISVAYASPDVLRDGVSTPQSDVWSLGIVVFTLYYKYNPYDPFCCRTRNQIQRMILRHPFQPVAKKGHGHWFPETTTSAVTPDARDFIAQCLAPLEIRASASQLLEHSLLKNKQSTT